MPSPLRAAWTEPTPPRPATRPGREAALVGGLAAITIVEGLLRTELHGHLGAVLATAALMLTLLWRRTRPLLALIVAVVGMSLLPAVSDAPDVYSSIFVLGLTYAVMRWGSGREAIVGTTAMLLYVAVDALARSSPAEDVIGAFAVVGGSFALGAAMRFRERGRRRALDEVRLLERERLARDLHDTVAHHVSAIAVRAQAGLAVAPLRPEAATEALAVIEAEASRTLAEMRTIVRVLRRGEDVIDAPNRRLADVALLADDGSAGPAVRVEVEGEADDVAPSVGAAVFRIAQEAITNARRHARGARAVDVRVRVGRDAVHLDVRDDGEPVTRAPGDGYGLAGMRERAALLGGTCSAGPGPEGGWTVTAALPRTGPTA